MLIVDVFGPPPFEIDTELLDDALDELDELDEVTVELLEFVLLTTIIERLSLTIAFPKAKTLISWLLMKL